MTPQRTSFFDMLRSLLRNGFEVKDDEALGVASVRMFVVPQTLELSENVRQPLCNEGLILSQDLVWGTKAVEHVPCFWARQENVIMSLCPFYVFLTIETDEELADRGADFKDFLVRDVEEPVRLSLSGSARFSKQLADHFCLGQFILEMPQIVNWRENFDEENRVLYENYAEEEQRRAMAKWCLEYHGSSCGEAHDLQNIRSWICDAVMSGTQPVPRKLARELVGKYLPRKTRRVFLQNLNKLGEGEDAVLNSKGKPMGKRKGNANTGDPNNSNNN